MIYSGKNTYFYILLIQLCFSLLYFSPVQASPDINNLAEIKIIAGKHIQGEEGFTIGIDIDLQGHWKTYWRVAGDAGLAPVLDWSKSSNIEGEPEIMWPTPTRFETYGLQNIGYLDHVLFPIKITAKDALKPIELALDINLLLCDEICVPFQKTLNKTIAPTAHKNPKTLQDNIDNLAKTNANAVLKNIKISKDIELDEDILSLALSLPKEYLNEKITDIFVYTTKELFFDAPDIGLKTDGDGALLTANMNLRIPLDDDEVLKDVLESDNNFSLTIVFEDSAPLLVDLNDNKDAIKIKSNIKSLVIPASIGLIILFAFVGGAILNVMPCVLPVLSLKFLSLIKSSDKSSKHIRIGFLASAFGIMVAFWSMAGFLAILKLGGHSIGWGMQFQHTGFLIFLCLVLITFALNLWGVFEINVPKFITSKLPNNSHHDHDSLMGHFLTGVLAAILATPCSAPFLGTAVGFALSQNTFVIFLIFSFLGLGLSLPYFIVAGFPAVAKHMPKPGAWMLKVKKAMSVALLITALWLGSIATNNLIGREVISTENSLWQKFNLEQINQAILEQKVVIVDITADWCLTCKANKSLVFDNAEIKSLLKQDNIIAMTGDWTQMNEDITKYINSFGRYGIPLNVIYSSKAPDGILLPELLSKKIIINTLEQAKP